MIPIRESKAKEVNFDPHELANEELRHVYRSRNNALQITLIAGLAAAVVLGAGAGLVIALFWYGWLLAASCWHWVIGRSSLMDRNAGSRFIGIKRHITAASLAGLGWGSLALTLPWLGRAGQDAILIMMIIAVITALPRLVVFLPIFFAFAGGVLAPLVLTLPFLEPEMRQVVLLVLMVLAVTLAFSASEMRGLLVQTLLKQISFERASWEDQLTGLGNRRRFDERLDESWRQAFRLGVPLSLIILDIDYFKNYNDNYGHPAGDECLRQVSNALNNCAKRAGDSVSRYGGEEFAVVLFHTPMNDARNLSEQLRIAVMDLKLKHEHSPHGIVTISLGGATIIPTPETQYEDLVRAADIALYRAKAAGRNRIEWNMPS